MTSSPTADQEPLGLRVKRLWEPAPGTSGRRRRQAGHFEPFIPAPIGERAFPLRDQAVAAVSSAAGALARLSSAGTGPASLNALAANLLRSESAASSRIEGLQISQKRLARAAFANRGKTGGDNRAGEVLGNVEAMKQAIEFGTGSNPFTVADIEAVHETLLRFTADKNIAGVIREEQNWIGGNDYNPIGAPYVPPPPEYVPALLEDFCVFLERDDLAPVAQAAIAHAQFENIHPFTDGNGRVGRSLIYAIFRRRGETRHYIPPISLVLGAEKKSYIGGFDAYSHGDVSTWVETFASATERAAEKAEDIAAEIETKQADWIERLGNPRADAGVRKLVANLPAQPVIDAAAAGQLTGQSHVSVGNALAKLEEAGILTPLSEKKWGRVWECDELLDLVEAYEEDIRA